jgi:hypothetical protein
MKPQNLEERIVWYAIIGTYGIYLIGGQSIFIPLIAWFLIVYLCKKDWNQTPTTPVQERITIPFTVWLWIICTVIVLIGLIISHINFEIGTDRFIKSLLKWLREYALWGAFPLIGCLNIRPQLLYRAACIVCLQSLILIPILYLAFILHLPSGTLYVSPLYYLGGNSPDLYSVVLYFFDDETGLPRLTFFAPWCPNLAIIAAIHFFLARQESNKKWRLIGMIGSIGMVVSTVSRMALLCFPIIILLTWILTNFTRPIIYFAAGGVSFLTSIFSAQLSNFFEIFAQKFNGARASSSEVRIALVRLSLERWWSEAPIWGHGFTEAEGPAIVYFFPVGTGGCGTWINLLYTKGLVGFIAFILPFAWSFVDLVIKAQKSANAKVGVSILLVFFFFSFIEELDTLSYIYWPGILMIGIALKEEVQAYGSLVMNLRQSILRG